MKDKPFGVLKELFKMPSTRGGKIRLLGLAAYTGLSVAFPQVPVAIKSLLTVIGAVLQ